jgi:hypothetical protein
MSTTTEVDSAYCPQCLTSWDAASSFSVARGRCYLLDKATSLTSVGCVNCPECHSVLTMSVVKKDCTKIELEDSSAQFTHIFMYQCGYCRWTSEECNIYHPIRVDKNVEDIDQYLKQASSQIQKMLLEMMESISSDNDVDSLISAWNQKVQEEEKNRRQVETVLKAHGITTVISNKVCIKEEMKENISNSSVDMLEERIQDKRERMNQIVIQDIINDIERIKVSSDQPLLSKIVRYPDGPMEQVDQQIISSSSKVTHAIPSLVPLRTRAVRRCLKELRLGRPGILVKPKMNPLEGDTSLRYGHGQWWKKDSSAVHNIPRVIIKASRRHPSTRHYAFLMNVKNPTIGPIRFRIHSNFDDSHVFPSHYNNVVIDPITLDTAKVDIVQPTKSESIMDLLALDGVEDSLLETEKSDRFDFTHWTDDTIEWDNTSAAKMIHMEKDSAWIEFIVRSGEHLNSSPASSQGSPIMMDIEISQGSWESSLIQSVSTSNGEKEMVSFVLLPVWKME